MVLVVHRVTWRQRDAVQYSFLSLILRYTNTEWEELSYIICAGACCC